MPCGGQPVENGLPESLGSHAGMAGHEEFEQHFFAACRQRLAVVFEDRLERLLAFPFRMGWRQRLDAVNCESKLDIDRLFAPQRAVVVENSDPFG